MPTLLGVQVAQLARDVGLSGDALVTAVAIAKAESSWNSGARNVTPSTGDDSHGLWQINIRPEANPQYGPAQRLYDPAANAQAMWEIYDAWGKTWKAWSTFNRGTYRLYLNEARTAASGIGNTGVTANETAPGVPPTPQFTPAPTASLVAGMGTIGPNELTLEGELITAKAKVISATLNRSIDEASSLTVLTLDEKRLLLESNLSQQRSRCQVDGIYFELLDVSKRGNDLALGLIDACASSYIHDRGKVITQAPGVATRGQFLKRLADEHPEWQVDIETGATIAEELRTEPGESLWEAMGRVARTVGWRRLATANRLLIGSDAWLASRTQPIVIGEFTDGIESIDFDYITGVEVDEARFTCNSRLWAGPPTQAITIEGLGWANGEWLVASISRTLGSTKATVSLTRPARVLPEPTPAVASPLEGFDLGAIVQGAAAGVDVDDSNTAWAGTQAICEALSADFPTLGLQAISRKRDRRLTTGGSVSDHWTGNHEAYAIDWSNGGSPTPQMDQAAVNVMARLGRPHNGQAKLEYSGIHTINGLRVRVQVLYRTQVGGNHDNHVHLGVERR